MRWPAYYTGGSVFELNTGDKIDLGIMRLRALGEIFPPMQRISVRTAYGHQHGRVNGLGKVKGKFYFIAHDYSWQAGQMVSAIINAETELARQFGADDSPLLSAAHHSQQLGILMYAEPDGKSLGRHLRKIGDSVRADWLRSIAEWHEEIASLGKIERLMPGNDILRSIDTDALEAAPSSADGLIHGLLQFIKSGVARLDGKMLEATRIDGMMAPDFMVVNEQGLAGIPRYSGPGFLQLGKAAELLALFAALDPKRSGAQRFGLFEDDVDTLRGTDLLSEGEWDHLPLFQALGTLGWLSGNLRQDMKIKAPLQAIEAFLDTA